MSPPVLLHQAPPSSALPLRPPLPTGSLWSQDKDKDTHKLHSRQEEAASSPLPPPHPPTTARDFPASSKAILLNISKNILTPSLFIYKNQLNTLLLCSIWKLEQPGLYLAETLLLFLGSQHSPRRGGPRKEGARGWRRAGCSEGAISRGQVSARLKGPGRVRAKKSSSSHGVPEPRLFLSFCHPLVLVRRSQKKKDREDRIWRRATGTRLGKTVGGHS